MTLLPLRLLWFRPLPLLVKLPLLPLRPLRLLLLLLLLLPLLPMLLLLLLLLLLLSHARKLRFVLALFFLLLLPLLLLRHLLHNGQAPIISFGNYIWLGPSIIWTPPFAGILRLLASLP